MKKIKKLKLNIDTISNLSDKKMENINGGGLNSGYGPCGSNQDCGPSMIACGSQNCGGSFVGTGTGYGMCCCNATGYCS